MGSPADVILVSIVASLLAEPIKSGVVAVANAVSKEMAMRKYTIQ